MARKTFGGYTNVTEVVSANAQTQILARVDLFLALFPDPESPHQPVHPDFDLVHPNTAAQIRAEITALKTAIDAAPTA